MGVVTKHNELRFGLQFSSATKHVVSIVDFLLKRTSALNADSALKCTGSVLMHRLALLADSMLEVTTAELLASLSSGNPLPATAPLEFGSIHCIFALMLKLASAHDVTVGVSDKESVLGTLTKLAFYFACVLRDKKKEESNASDGTELTVSPGVLIAYNAHPSPDTIIESLTLISSILCSLFSTKSGWRCLLQTLFRCQNLAISSGGGHRCLPQLILAFSAICDSLRISFKRCLSYAQFESYRLQCQIAIATALNRIISSAEVVLGSTNAGDCRHVTAFPLAMRALILALPEMDDTSRSPEEPSQFLYHQYSSLVCCLLVVLPRARPQELREQIAAIIDRSHRANIWKNTGGTARRKTGENSER